MRLDRFILLYGDCMEIYLDVLIIVNTYISLILLSLIETVTHFNIKKMNLTIASLISGVSSLLILIDGKGIYMSLFICILKLLTLSAVALIAFHGAATKRKILYLLYFIGLNVLLGGIVKLLSEEFESSVFFIYNSTVYFDISVYMLMVVTAVVYLVISLAERISRYKLSSAKKYKIKVKYNDKEYVLDGLADTGNSAHDLFTGKPVVVCKGISLYDGTDKFVRIIPYTTISGEGLLYAVNPESVTVIDENSVTKEVDVYVAGVEADSNPLAVFNPTILR